MTGRRRTPGELRRRPQLVASSLRRQLNSATSDVGQNSPRQLTVTLRVTESNNSSSSSSTCPQTRVATQVQPEDQSLQRSRDPTLESTRRSTRRTASRLASSYSTATPESHSPPPQILLATDNHIGYAETDPVRGMDSINTFREILQLAVANDVRLEERRGGES